MEVVMEINMNYVEWIQSNKIFILSEDKRNKIFLKSLGAKKKLFKKNEWILKYQDDNDLAKKMMQLRDNDFMFAGGHQGWEPISIFRHLRKKKLITGRAVEIVWKGKDQPITWEI